MRAAVGERWAIGARLPHAPPPPPLLRRPAVAPCAHARAAVSSTGLWGWPSAGGFASSAAAVPAAAAVGPLRGRGASRVVAHSSASHTAEPRHGIPPALKHLAVEQLKTTPKEYAAGESVLDSIVKVFCVYSRPDWLLPWQTHPKREGTGTGFVIRDRLIMTNAHVVADSTFITVKRHGSGTKFRADVVAVGHAVDLALLTVADEAFWAEPTPMLPLRLAPDVPQLQENVLVVGMPQGGENTSITSGVVSRVEVTQYVHAAAHLMAIQIDAAINPGNSGGPALRGAGGGNEVVGVAFQNLPSADSIGYIIPTNVVDRFLSEVMRHGEYRGYTSLGIVFQTLENAYLRNSLGMGPGLSGVLVNRVQPTSPTAKVLRKGDVLLAFDGVQIANDGSVHLRARERIFFTYLISQKPTGSTARLRVLRDGEVVEFDVTMQPLQTLVPICKYDEVPSFLMYAGLVFVPLSQPFLHEHGEDWVSSAPRRLVEKALNGLMQRPHQQIVILSMVLVDDVNTGFQGFQNLQVLRVNGQDVLNLRHLKRLLATAEGPYIRIDLEDDRVCVLDRAVADASTPVIQARYRVPFLESADLAGAEKDGGLEGAAGEGESETGAGPQLAQAPGAASSAIHGSNGGSGGPGAADGGSGEGPGGDGSDSEGADKDEGWQQQVPAAEPTPVVVAAVADAQEANTPRRAQPPRKRRKQQGR